MKKSVFALVAASALLFVACSDDGSGDSPATRAELCAATPKLTLGCLEGKWKLVEVGKFLTDGTETQSDPLTDAGTGLLTVSADGSFTYVTNNIGNSFNGTLVVSADSASVTVNKIIGDFSNQVTTTAATVSETQFLLGASAFEEFTSSSFNYKDYFEYVAE